MVSVVETAMAIRTLGRDEPIPTGEPRRYLAHSGYVRLRWRVGTEDYVEEYEHRVTMGRPAGDVHHLNGDKGDNRPDNLVVLTKAQHTAHHQVERPRTGRARDQQRAQRRAEEAARWEAIAAAYTGGASLVACGDLYGLHHSNVSRGLRRRGVAIRRPS